MLREGRSALAEQMLETLLAENATPTARARFETIAGAGHLTPVEQPEAVSELLAGFWA